MSLIQQFSSNPFSTRFVRPGAIPFIFSGGQTVVDLIQELRDANWRGQIVGPHGSGKSTLLCTIIAEIDPLERTVVRFTLNAGQRSLPVDPHEFRKWTAQTLIVIDGFEQLSYWQRRKIKNLCSQNRAGLVVTAHRSVGLPTIHETTVDASSARKVISRLLADEQFTVRDDDLRRLVATHHGNLRDVLFELFDLYRAAQQQTSMH